MYSLLQRLNGVFAFTFSVLVAIIAFISVSSLFIPTSQDVALKITSAKLLFGQYGRQFYSYDTRQTEYAFLSFDLDADFTNVYHWNTKEVFLYVVLSYKSNKNKWNEIVIWDQIITSKEDANLTIRNQQNKYAVTEFDTKLKGLEMGIKLQWNVVPYVGMLTQHSQNVTLPLVLPNQYDYRR